MLTRGRGPGPLRSRTGPTVLAGLFACALLGTAIVRKPAILDLELDILGFVRNFMNYTSDEWYAQEDASKIGAVKATIQRIIALPITPAGRGGVQTLCSGCLGSLILFPGQPVMRQVDRSGSLPPRWVTKSFSACGVITTRRARHASPGQKERPRAAAARLAAPRRPAPRLASPCSSARAHAPTRPRSLRESEATLQASSEPGAKRSRLEPRTGSTTAAGGSCKGIKGSA